MARAAAVPEPKKKFPTKAKIIDKKIDVDREELYGLDPEAYLGMVHYDMKTIAAIKSRYYSIARQLKAPAAHVQFATTPQHDGSPHVEKDGKSYCYVVTERGQEFERRRTTDPVEVLYWLVSDVTRAMASDHELRHRTKRKDFRRLLFKKHLELLADVSDEWSQRKKTEYDRVLAEHPFRDEKG